MKTIRKVFYCLAAAVMVACSPEATPEDSGSVTPPADETPVTPPEDEPAKQPVTAELKVMSFNIKVDATDDTTTPNGWGTRKHAILSMIAEHAPLLIGVQEANYTNQWSYLKEALKDKYNGIGVNRDTGQEGGTGEVMGIFYDKNQLELHNSGTFWLSESPDTPSLGWGASYKRSATWTIFSHKETGARFCYINTHLDHQVAAAQENGMKLLVERFGEINPDGYAQILSGDFNITANKVVYITDTMKNTRTSAPAASTDNYTTYNGWTTTKNSIIDHIYVSKDVRVLSYLTINKTYNNCQFISDHYPIMATIQIKDLVE